MQYRAEIDGLRAVAVLPVILFHAGIASFTGGYIGVDVFFVISGYLITGILLADLDAGRYSLARFYERRARRILPALFLVTAACIPAAWAWLLPRDMQDFAESVVAVATFWSNILFWRQTGYFDTAAELKPLLHTWSLAVEEQYYILFPPFLWLVHRYARRWLPAALAAILVASLAAAQWAATTHPAAAFFLLPTRAWELMLGALLAVHGRTAPVPLRQAGGLAGLAMIAAAVFGFDALTPSPGLLTLLPTGGAALVILCATPGTVAGAILGWRPMVAVGLVSYSAYLWHQPLLAFARYRSLGEPSAWLMAGLAAASLPLAWLTWRFVERPWRQRGRIGRPALALGMATGAAALLGFGAFGHLSHGIPDRIVMPPNVVWPSFRERTERLGETCDLAPLPGIAGVSACSFGDAAGTRTLALFGDSHARAISAALDRMLRARGWRGLQVHLPGCEMIPWQIDTREAGRPDLFDCRHRFARMTAYLTGKVAGTVVAVRWSSRLTPVPGAETMGFDNTVGGVEKETERQYAVLGEDGSLSLDPAAKAAALARLVDGFAAAAPVYLVYPIPEVAWDIFRLNVNHFSAHRTALPTIATPSAVYRARNRFVLGVFDALVAGRADIIPIHPEAIFCDTFLPGQCAAQVDTVPYYYDDDHLSDIGADLVVARIAKRLPD